EERVESSTFYGWGQGVRVRWSFVRGARFVSWCGVGSEINPRPNQSRRVTGDLLGNARFGKGDGQGAFAAVGGGLGDAGMDEGRQCEVQIHLLLQIATRRRAGFQSVDALQISRAAESE